MLQLSVFGDGGLNRVTEETCLIHVDKKYNVVWCGVSGTTYSLR